MTEPTLPEQIAAIESAIESGSLWQLRDRGRDCLRATLAMLTRLQAAEQAREPGKRQRGRGAMPKF